jgi:hypothetical protein
LSQAKVRKISLRYSLAELDVKSFYFILFYSGGGGREVHETFKGGPIYKMLGTSALGYYHVIFLTSPSSLNGQEYRVVHEVEIIFFAVYEMGIFTNMVYNVCKRTRV